MPITPQTVDFLAENRLQNNRDWYYERKDEYNKIVRDPLLELAGGLGETIRTIDPQIVTIPSRVISRVWRDTRYSHDKTLFRDTMWLAFRRGKGMAWPTLFFEFSPRLYRYGCGYYNAPPIVRDKVAEWVLADDKRYKAAKKAVEKLPQCSLQGEHFKRTKYPDAPKSKAEWVERKDLSVWHEGKDADFLFGPDLQGTLEEVFTGLKPYYDLLLAAHMEVEADLPRRR